MRLRIAGVVLPILLEVATSKSAPPESTGHTVSQEEDLARLRQLGAQVEMDAQEPNRLAAVVLAGKPATDATLADLEHFTDLAELSVCGQGITDAGLAHLKTLHRLHRLDLQYTRITDAGLNCVKGLVALKELNLGGSFQITDAGLRQLKALSALQSLDLTFTQVTDQGIDDLQRAMPNVTIHRRYDVSHTANPKDGALDDKAALPRDERVDRLKRQALPFDAEKPGRPADWTTLAIALDEILKASPERIGAWERLAWNLSYNAAAEFKDVRDRYWWVKQGILVLLAGSDKNPTSGRLLFNLGWCVSQRIGRADDAEQLRQLFVDDTQMQSLLLAGFRREDVLGPAGKPDNWLVARQWFIRAEPLEAKEYDRGQDSRSPLIFYSSASMCQINYAITIEKEGVFGEVAKAAWVAAANEWRDYGNKEIPTLFKDEKTQEPIVIRLNEQEMKEQAAKKLAAQLDAMQPGLREKIMAEKRAALTKAQREALDTPEQKRTGKQFDLAAQAEDSVKTTHDEVARRITGPRRDEAKKLAKKADAHEQMAVYIRRYREIVNFDYWQSRCRAEQLPSTLLARQLMYEAKRELKNGRLDSNNSDQRGAKQLFEQGFLVWKQSLTACPTIEDDEEVSKEVVGAIMLYRQKILEDRPLPEDFALKKLVDRWNQSTGHGKE